MYGKRNYREVRPVTGVKYENLTPNITAGKAKCFPISFSVFNDFDRLWLSIHTLNGSLGLMRDLWEGRPFPWRLASSPIPGHCFYPKPYNQRLIIRQRSNDLRPGHTREIVTGTCLSHGDAAHANGGHGWLNIMP